MKRFICLFLTMVLLVLTYNNLIYECFASDISYEIYRGDLNVDGKVDTEDLANLKLMLADVDKSSALIADIDYDCIVNTTDFALLKLFLAGVYDYISDSVPIVGSYDIDNNTFSLNEGLPSGTYALNYETALGEIEDYSEICKLQINENGEGTAYSGFIKENSAPAEAVTIGVYSSNKEKVGEILLDGLKKTDLGQKLYSFGALSDVHLQRKTGEEDYERALTYFNTEEQVEFITVAGDYTVTGTEEEMAQYQAFVEKYSPNIPIYEITGNHEGQQPQISNYVEKYTGEPLYYSFTYGNDVFIMVGDATATQNLFTDEEMTWLYETLEENKDKRCFVFQHVPSLNTSGMAADIYENNNWGGKDAVVYESLMEHYSNVIWFHGHSHLKFELQSIDKKANYDGSQGFHSVHISSLAVPRTVDSSNKRVESYEDSQGYVVDVYENAVVLRGRDFISGSFLPIATYTLNTTTRNVDADTYLDYTGTVLNSNTNILAEEGNWYKSKVDKSNITKITFAQEYDTDVYDELWDAGIIENGQVMVYRNGTELTVTGNKYGIQLNADSDNMFKDFVRVVEINGLDVVKSANLTSFTGVFLNCQALKEIDVSNLNFKNIRRIDEAFKNCSSLKKVELMSDIAQNSIYKDVYMLNLFYGCSALEYVDFSVLPDNKIYYTSCVFYGCENLKEVKFGGCGISNATNMFLKCTSLKNVDLSNVDFSTCTSFTSIFQGCKNLEKIFFADDINLSKVKSIKSAFKNCYLLVLDCSAWDMPALTDNTSANENAPGVILPNFKLNSSNLGDA